MNWSEFFRVGAFVQINAEHYWVANGPFWRTDFMKSDEDCLFTPDFFLKSKDPWWIPRDSAVVSREDFLANIGLNLNEDKPAPWMAADDLHFSEQFRFIHESIGQGEVKKAVPVTFEVQKKTPNLVSLLHRLLSPHENLWAYGCWDEEGGMAGLTPELLFAQRGDMIESMAIAGTRSKSDKKRLPLLSDRKELEEHGLVVDAIYEKLNLWGISEKSRLEVVDLPTLEHLKTRLRVKTNEAIGFEKIAQTLHPTPALGTWPADKGLSYLQKMDRRSYLRKKFGAPFGVSFANGDGICLVAIRNIQWDKEQTFLFSGCGIVEKSELSREWQELAEKRHSVKKLLGLDS